jgi:hypothetical protein
MPTRTYTIPMDRLFSNQTNYGNMDLESQKIKEEEQLRADIARENLLRIATTPMSPSNIDTFLPEMVQSEFPIPDAEPYSPLTARQAPPSIVGGCLVLKSLVLKRWNICKSVKVICGQGHWSLQN